MLLINSKKFYCLKRNWKLILFVIGFCYLISTFWKFTLKLKQTNSLLIYLDSTNILRLNSNKSPDQKSPDYDLRVSVIMANSTKQQYSMDYYYTYLERKFARKPLNGSKMEKLVQMDALMRINNKKSDYSLYPQVVNAFDIIRSVQTGKPIDQEPINNDKIFAHHIPGKYCRPQDDEEYEVIVLIQSCPNCFEERRNARLSFMKTSLWLNFKICFVFVTSYAQISDKNVNLTTMETKKLISSLREESNQYGDILIGSFHDSELAKTMRLILAIRWAAAFCQSNSNLFLFTNDKQALVPNNFKDFIKRIPQAIKSDIVIGIPGRNLDVSKRVDSNQFRDIPWNRYPPYFHESGFMLGSKIVQYAAIITAFTKNMPWHDIYLGFVLTKLNLFLIRCDDFLPPDKKVTNSKYVLLANFTEVSRIYDWESGRFY